VGFAIEHSLDVLPNIEKRRRKKKRSKRIDEGRIEFAAKERFTPTVV